MDGRRRLRFRSVRRAAAAVLVATSVVFATGCESGGGHPISPAEAGNAETAKVTKVVDGDTVHLSGIGSSRIIGVDTPETNAGPECFGDEATEFTASRLEPGTTVTYRLGDEPRDRFDRALVYIWEPDGTFFNEELVRLGYAEALSIRPNTEFANRFESLAAKARDAGLGLWAASECGPGGPAPSR